MNIIVTGAAGFIGTVLIQDLLNLGYNVIGVDIAPSIIKNDKYSHYQIDITTKNINILPDKDIYCVCHLAAKIRVDESMKDPTMYYHHNVIGTLNLISWCHDKNITNIIFASTAAVYTDKKDDGFDENDETEISKIQSVYGKTKLMNEQMLHDYALSYNFKGYIFRFFNVCGGSEKNHGTPVHLLPIIINNIINNKQINIYGTDYKTVDGTCLRDYIHLKDISNGFVKAIQKGFTHNGFKTYNLGSGNGHTVKEIIYQTIKVYNEYKNNTKCINVNHTTRRPGDIDILLANTNKALKELEWTPKHTLNEMIYDTLIDFES